MVTTTGVKEAVNKARTFSFSVTTTDGTSTNVVTAAQVAAEGFATIRDIHLKCTGDKCFLGLGKAASTTHG